jgi:hypothetical protein
MTVRSLDKEAILKRLNEEEDIDSSEDDEEASSEDSLENNVSESPRNNSECELDSEAENEQEPEQTNKTPWPPDSVKEKVFKAFIRNKRKQTIVQKAQQKLRKLESDWEEEKRSSEIRKLLRFIIFLVLIVM